jgi:hypothetical protein
MMSINVMHAKPDLRVFLKWMINCSGSVITAVMRTEVQRLVFGLVFFLTFVR